MREILIQIMDNGVELLILVLFTYGVAFLKSKLGNERFIKCVSMIKTAVKAIEQTMGVGNGEVKKQAVIDFVKKYVGKFLTNDEIDKLVESAVYELKKVTEAKVK